MQIIRKNEENRQTNRQPFESTQKMEASSNDQKKIYEFDFVR